MCHEVNDELSQGNVERSIFERQLLGRGTLDADPGVTLSSCRDEGLGRIDGRHATRSQPPDQLGGERAGAAADIERALTGGDACEVGELRGEGAEYRPMKRSYSSAPTTKLIGAVYPPGAVERHERPRAFDVVGDRLDQLLDGVEPHLVAEPFPELDGERVAAKLIVGEVQEERLDVERLRPNVGFVPTSIAAT